MRAFTGFLVGLFMLVGFAARPAAAATCPELAMASFPGTTITEARLVPAGTFTAPATGRGGADAERRFADLPSFCRILGRVETSPQSTILFEVWLPERNWNGLFLANGFAFYGGLLEPDVLASALRKGYATATTDSGGGGRDRGGAFLYGQPEKQRDYSGRAWHETVTRAKTLIASYYGKGPTQSHWEACGGGARGGLQAAAQYPGDFDAIAVGAANYTTRLVFAQMGTWQAAQASPGSGIPQTKLPMLHKAAVDKCDANDGAVDGVIQDPSRCQFDPGVLQCKSADGADCLTAEQVATARAVYAGVTDVRNGRRLGGGLYPGSELGWSGASGQPSSMAVDFFKYVVFKNPTWDPRTRPVNFDSDITLTEAPEIKALDISSALGEFVARGSKLVLYSGWADTATSPQFSMDYYNDVVKTAGATARNGVRLFMVGGMGHCPGTTGASAYDFDPLALATTWKTTGRAPDQFTAARYQSGKPDGTALVCAYPAVPVSSGGNVKDAASFVCKAP